MGKIKYPDFSIESDDEIKKLEKQLSEKKERLKIEKEKEKLEKEKDFLSTNPEILDTKLKGKKPFQYIEEMDVQKGAGRIRKIINWWKKGRTKRAVLCNMELRNGNYRSFIVYTSENGFVYNHARYLFDSESSYYNVDFRLWCFDYHEDLTIPIKKRVPLKEIKDSISEEYEEIEHSLNPNTIENFVVAEVSKNILAGASVWEFLRNARLIWIITLIIGLVNVLILLWHSGVFDKLTGAK